MTEATKKKVVRRKTAKVETPENDSIQASLDGLPYELAKLEGFIAQAEKRGIRCALDLEEGVLHYTGKQGVQFCENIYQPLKSLTNAIRAANNYRIAKGSGGTPGTDDFLSTEVL